MELEIYILFKILIVQLIIFVDCTLEGQVMDTVNGECVCAEDYYQTSTGDGALVCAECPTGSSTNGATNSQDISACGRYSKIIIHALVLIFYFSEGK